MDVEFTTAYNEGLSTFNSIVWMCQKALGGILIIILLALACRFLLRAWLSSNFGNTAAKVGGGVIELSLITFCFLKNLHNPAGVVTTLGWCAAFFQAISGGDI